MLRLDKITLHNFKSFRHATINFSKGFNCVVGPNGSGKSNICDALLFALGETSLRRMRVSSAKSLINASAKSVKEDGVKRAYTTVSFSGDENLEISRIIKSNNKISYRINGKKSTRQQVLDVLRANRADINETNTIIQGEITKILNMSPKERRVLIDIAAGIKEFDDKKDAATKELEKVEGKINEANIMLSERGAFLSELEKEKIDAERYTELQSKIKRITYTILKAREAEINKEYSKYVADYEKLATRKKSLEAEQKKLEDELSSAISYKDKISKKMNEGSIEVGTANRVLDEINANIKIKEALIKQLEESLIKSKDKEKGLAYELSKTKEQIDLNSQNLAILKSDLSIIEKKLEKYPVAEEGDREVMLKYSQLQKNLLEVDSTISELNAEHLSSNAELHMLESTKKEAESRSKELSNIINETSTAENLLEDKIKKISAELESKSKEVKSLEKTQVELKTAYDKVEADIISIREQLALSGRSQNRITPILNSSIKKGFYGKVSELFSCDEEYSIAVYAALGNRLNYYVVESIAIATQAIEIIKQTTLGRASFIPLNEINSFQTAKEGRNIPLINYVTFDEKYRKAFEFVLANTYLIDNINSLSKKEINKHRFVTREGEVLEQSGLITGGKFTMQQLPAALESRFAKLSNEKTELNKKIADLDKEIQSYKKEVYILEQDAIQAASELKHTRSDKERINAEIMEKKEALKSSEKRIIDLSKMQSDVAGKKIELEKRKEAIKTELDRLYHAINDHAASKSKKEAEESAEELKEMRHSAEKIRIKIAELEKENEMNSSRNASISSEIKEEGALIKELQVKISDAEKTILEYGKHKAEVQSKINAHGTASEKLLKEVQAADEKISKLGFDKGKISSDFDKIEREIIETEGKRSQLQTRLSDIKAELISYQAIQEVDYKSVEELERQSTECKHEIDLLGNVNLKAPEAYEQRKKDLDEAKIKMDILDREKTAILSMISEIESKKLSVFNQTLDEVNQTFKRLYSTVFDIDAYIYLDGEKDDPFNSKLMFSIKKGARKKNDESMSGGEKSILMLSLIFSVQMRKPMSFYIFDEIDVALDKENSKKLSKLIRELSKASQFIVVSHNDSLITMAEAAIGVAMQDSYSRAVGIEMINQSGVTVGKK